MRGDRALRDAALAANFLLRPPPRQETENLLPPHAMRRSGSQRDFLEGGAAKMNSDNNQLNIRTSEASSCGPVKVPLTSGAFDEPQNIFFCSSPKGLTFNPALPVGDSPKSPKAVKLGWKL